MEMVLPILPAIRAVHVVEGSRSYQAAVRIGIKSLRKRLCGKIGIENIERLVPLSFGFEYHGIKIPVRHLGCEISRRAPHTGARDPYPRHQRAVRHVSKNRL